VKLILFSKPDCHLCADAVAELARLRAKYPHEVDVVDITSDPALEATYGERIPVLRSGEREVDAPLTRTVLERALRDASRTTFG
jgi:hypothetical protein